MVKEGYRRTLRRQKVLEILQRHSGQYLDGEEIFRLVRQEYPGIGMATIYRTLTLLAKLNHLSVLLSTDNGNRYRLRTGAAENGKCWLVYRKCGVVEECLAQSGGPVELPEKGFFMEEVCIYGICRECLKNKH